MRFGSIIQCWLEGLVTSLFQVFFYSIWRNEGIYIIKLLHICDSRMVPRVRRGGDGVPMSSGVIGNRDQFLLRSRDVHTY